MCAIEFQEFLPPPHPHPPDPNVVKSKMHVVSRRPLSLGSYKLLIVLEITSLLFLEIRGTGASSHSVIQRVILRFVHQRKEIPNLSFISPFFCQVRRTAAHLAERMVDFLTVAYVVTTSSWNYIFKFIV